MLKASGTYTSISNGAFDKLSRFGVHAYRARAVDHALALDSLGKEGHWRGRLVGRNGFLLRHDGEVAEGVFPFLLAKFCGV